LKASARLINRIVDELIADIKAKGGNWDLIADFAEPLPVKVHCGDARFPRRG
jgi:cytochrome P450